VEGRLWDRRVARRRRVVAAAAQVFARCGYHEASMDEIARRVGVSKPMLYKLFSSKLELYSTVVGLAADWLVGGLSEALCWARGPATVASATVSAYFDFVDDHPDYSVVLFDATAVEPSTTRWTASSVAARCVEVVSEAIEPHAAARARSSRLLAAALVGQVQSCARQWLAAGRPIGKHEAAAAVMRLCWRGLAGVPLDRQARSAVPLGDRVAEPDPVVRAMTRMGEWTPITAWKVLREGNDRFMTGRLRHPNQGVADRAELAASQAPSAAVFGCGDSRVAAEIIFDQGLGDMFVVRTAGHVVDVSVLGSIEYAVAMLGVPLVVVLGHDNCATVRATVEALDTGAVPDGFIRSVIERVTPSVLLGRREGLSSIDELHARHVVETAELLRQRSRLIADRIATGSCAIACVTYTLADGKATLTGVIGDIGEVERPSGPTSE
jgi:carbonic anhydrase